MTTSTRGPSLTPPVESDELWQFTPVDGTLLMKDGHISGTFIVNGHYYTGYVSPAFMPLGGRPVLTIQTEPTFRMLLAEQTRIGEDAHPLNQSAQHFVLGRLLAGQVGGAVSAAECWVDYIEAHHLESLSETSRALFDHRQAFSQAWLAVASMVTNL